MAKTRAYTKGQMAVAVCLAAGFAGLGMTLFAGNLGRIPRSLFEVFLIWTALSLVLASVVATPMLYMIMRTNISFLQSLFWGFAVSSLCAAVVLVLLFATGDPAFTHFLSKAYLMILWCTGAAIVVRAIIGPGADHGR